MGGGQLLLSIHSTTYQPNVLSIRPGKRFRFSFNFWSLHVSAFLENLWQNAIPLDASNAIKPNDNGNKATPEGKFNKLTPLAFPSARSAFPAAHAYDRTKAMHTPATAKNNCKRRNGKHQQTMARKRTMNGMNVTSRIEYCFNDCANE